MYAVLHQVFDIEVSSRKLFYRNERFQEKVFEWFNGDTSLNEELNQQKIATGYNNGKLVEIPAAF